MSNICYFEIPVDDMERAQAFYSQLFGWTYEKMAGAAPESCDYYSIATGSPDQQGIAYGGMLKRQSPKHPVTQYIAVPSVTERLKEAEALGATVLVPKSAVPGMGYFAVCLDTEKNAFGLWECDERAQ